METSREKTNRNLIKEPYKYHDRIPEMILDFFDRAQDINGKTYPTPLPTVEGFCKTIYISKTTFHGWLKREPEMKKAYDIAKNFQYEQLIYLTQIGFYKEGISKMLAANLTDLKSEVQLAKEAENQSAEGRKDLTLNYSVNQLPRENLVSVPTLTEFNPNLIPYQYEVIKDIRTNYDYNLGVHEIMLSGSVGSAKSLLMVHIVVTHCIMNKGAVALIGRKAFPQLRDTMIQMILDHLSVDVSFKFNISRGIFEFSNGSKIIGFSWSDKAYKKVRSYALSCAAIEELTENRDMEFYKEIKMRVGRIPGITENFMISATNPDAPDHPAYKYFIEKESEIATRHVYYSLTEQNPFLPRTYIENLKETLSPKEADRMLRGKWVAIHTDVVFYNYDKPRNFVDHSYQWNRRLRFDIFFDFNIGHGKPMSAAVGQVDPQGRFHIAKDFVIEGARTLDICEEMLNSGILEGFNTLNIFGDCNGFNRDTRNTSDDYSIIKHFFENNGFRVNLQVKRSNPDLRASENLVNALCYNDHKEVKLFVYKDAQTSHEGLSFTKYKKGAKLIQDDSDYFQHVSTAIRYWTWQSTHYTDKRNIPVTIGSYR